jgi:GTPase SAR1 family protein
MVKRLTKDVLKDEVWGIFSELYRDVKEKLLPGVQVEVRRKVIEAQQQLVGQSIAVLGPPGAGKTTLLKVFKDPNAEEHEIAGYDKTEVKTQASFSVDFMLTPNTSEQFRFRFKVRKSADVGGEEYIRDGHWADVVRDAGAIIYVADWQRLSSDADGSYTTRVRRDFEWILQNTQLLRPGFKIVLAANKIDQLCTKENFREFRAQHQLRLNQLREELLREWPDHLAPNMGPALLISLLNKTLRQFTLNGLMLSLVSTDLDAILRESSVGIEDA